MDLERIIKNRYIKRNAWVFGRNQIRAKLATVALGPRYTTIAWKLLDPHSISTALNLGEEVALATGVKEVMVYRDHNFVIYQFQLHSQFWREYTRKDVDHLGIGIGERLRQVDIDFPDIAPQMGIYGMPGSGKTELIKTAICALASEYTPNQLQFVISDWHRQLTDFSNLAHLALPIAYNNEKDTDNVINFVQQERLKRLEGSQEDYYRLVFVIDEAAEIVGNEKRIQLLGAIANSRKWKINMILGTQKPSMKELPNILDKIGNRHVGKVLNAQMSANVTGVSNLEAHKLSGGGDFLKVIGGQHWRYQAVLSTDSDIAKLPRVVQVPTTKIEINETTQVGRPKNEIEPKLVADYVANYELSVRKFIEEFKISQNKYYLHKNFVQDLEKELARYGLGICKLEEIECLE